MVEQKKACPITDTLFAASGRFGGRVRSGSAAGSSLLKNAHSGEQANMKHGSPRRGLRLRLNVSKGKTFHGSGQILLRQGGLFIWYAKGYDCLCTAVCVWQGCLVAVIGRSVM